MLDSQTLAMMAEGTGATLYMTLMSTLFGYILGLPMGIILVVTAPTKKVSTRIQLFIKFWM